MPPTNRPMDLPTPWMCRSGRCCAGLGMDRLLAAVAAAPAARVDQAALIDRSVGPADTGFPDVPVRQRILRSDFRAWRGAGRIARVSTVVRACITSGTAHVTAVTTSQKISGG